MFQLDNFINEYVTHRDQSMFLPDIEMNREILSNRINGKSILVIGGAGSIGSSFIRAILHFKPESLYVVDTNENALAELTRDLRSTKELSVPDEYVTYPMSFSSDVFKKMFRKHKGFEFVASQSPQEHELSEKDIFSIEALLKNNLLNAKKLLDLMSVFPPEEYFCVSTDKAANPVNIMGASKRIMEDMIFSYSDKFPVKTARFANVAFSNGSLPAGFLARMEKLQPLSAPSDVRRFFVSPEESGHICMLSCMLGDNREIFFPKLSEETMMSFDAIAEKLIMERGYDILYCSSDEEAIEKATELWNGSQRYPVHFSPSDTSGEKPYEEFYIEGESLDSERFSSLGVITEKPLPDRSKVDYLFENLEHIFNKDNYTKEEIVKELESYLPTFHHIETGKSLDSKM